MNPIFFGWYADPEMHIFAGRYYLYPTYSAKYDDQTFFEVWPSSTLTEWHNEGRILDFADVPWSTNRCGWAPSIIERHGRYFFYFSAGDGTGLGVAASDHPAGPFADALGKPLVATYPYGTQPIDAHAFLDDDGQTYLYFGDWFHAVVVKLNEDMITLDGDFLEIIPDHYVESPFMLKRQGVYYFMWSEGGWGDSSYAVAYAKSDSPLGPFTRAGTVLESDSAVGTSAGHHSVLNYPGTDDWYIAYHR
ncbi:MAG: family 43 glycosylhydrolase [Janthinobacterium lividum]